MLSSGCMTVSRSGEGGAALLLVFMLPLMLPLLIFETLLPPGRDE